MVICQTLETIPTHSLVLADTMINCEDAALFSNISFYAIFYIKKVMNYDRTRELEKLDQLIVKKVTYTYILILVYHKYK